MVSTVLSRKGQVVIPKSTREELGLTPGTVFTVVTRGKKVVLEPAHHLPHDVFVSAGGPVTSRLLADAKRSSDKAMRLLKDLGVELG